MPGASVYSGIYTPGGIYRYSYFSFANPQRKSNGNGWKKTHADEINNVNIYTLTKITWFVVSKQ